MEQALNQLGDKILFNDYTDFDEMRWTIVSQRSRNNRYCI